MTAVKWALVLVSAFGAIVACSGSDELVHCGDRPVTGDACRGADSSCFYELARGKSNACGCQGSTWQCRVVECPAAPAPGYHCRLYQNMTCDYPSTTCNCEPGSGDYYWQCT
jgi:hypothetical protein